MLIRAVRAAALFSLLFAQIPEPAPAQAPENTNSARNTLEMPFNYVGGSIIVVRGQIGERTNLRFIIDLGSTYTLVDRKFANAIEEKGANLEVSHFSKTIESTEIVLPDLMVGPLGVKNFHAYLTDFSAAPNIPSGIDAVIGLDILQTRNMTIDFLEQKIYFPSSVEGKHQAALESCDVCVAVIANWKGIPVKLALSTGVEVITLDQARVKEKGVNLRGSKKGTLNNEYTVTPVKFFEQSGMTLSDTSLRGQSVIRIMHWPGPVNDLDGFLPVRALGANRISLDFARQLLVWDDPVPANSNVKMARR